MRTFVILISAILSAGTAGSAESKLVYAKDGSGVFGYKHTPIQPWSGYHVHDPDRPSPVKVTPAPTPGGAPSDALVLFDGRGLDQWQPARWKVADGYLESTEGNLISRRQFGDCQIHVEWQTPEPQGDIMNRGNNGILLMGLIEIQIFDSYNTKIYPDGQAAAVYGQTPPLVDAALAPGKWQTYDIIFLEVDLVSSVLNLEKDMTPIQPVTQVPHSSQYE